MMGSYQIDVGQEFDKIQYPLMKDAQKNEVRRHFLNIVKLIDHDASDKPQTWGLSRMYVSHHLLY